MVRNPLSSPATISVFMRSPIITESSEWAFSEPESPRSKEAGVLVPAPTLLACLCERGRLALVGSAADFSADALWLRGCRSFGARIALHSHVVARPLPRP